MISSELGIIVLAQDGSLTEQEIAAQALRSFSCVAEQPTVCVVRCTKETRMQMLNACLEAHLDASNRFIALDAALLQTGQTDAAIRHIRKTAADMYCACDPAPRPAALRKRHSAVARYLCTQSAFWYFSANAVRRMRSADSKSLVQETLADTALSVAVLPKALSMCSGSGSKTRFFLYVCDVHHVLCVGAASALLGSIAFLVCLLADHFGRQQWNASFVAGCLVCAHLFVFSSGALLIRWYRQSAARELDAREHQFLEETRLQ